MLLLLLLLPLSWLTGAVFFPLFLRSAHFTLSQIANLTGTKANHENAAACIAVHVGVCVPVCVLVYVCASVCAHNILFNAHFVHNLLLMNASAMLGLVPARPPACPTDRLANRPSAWLAVSCHRFAANCAHKWGQAAAQCAPRYLQLPHVLTCESKRPQPPVRALLAALQLLQFRVSLQLTFT